MKHRALPLAVALLAALCLSQAAHAGGPPAPHGDAAADETPRRQGRVITHVESYVQLAPVMAPLQADMRLRGMMQIDLGLDTPTRQMRRRIEERMPYLRDAYAATIADYTSLYYHPGEVPDADRIAEMLQLATNDILGSDEAVVLLSMINIHRR